MSSTNSKSGAELFVQTLEEYGVTHLFGNPGTTELPVMDALSTSDLDYVLSLHEDIAVGMAAGYASTRRYHYQQDPDAMPVGVVNLHVAPGMAHGLGNLYGAAKSGVPLVVTAGAHSAGFQHKEPNLHGDTVEMTQQFTKWSAEVKHIDALSTMLRRAFRIALTPPTGPVFLALPLDVMVEQTTDEPERLGAIPTMGSGNPAQLERAANAVVAAEDPVLILGDQVARTGTEAIEAAVDLAEVSGARVYGEMIQSEINFPTGHDQYHGRVPFDEESAREEMDADLIIFVGSTTHQGSVEFAKDPFPADATYLQISNESWEIGKNHHADIAVLADPGSAMGELAANIEAIGHSTEDNRRHKERANDRSRPPEPPSGKEGLSKAQLAQSMFNVAPNALIVNESITSTRALWDCWTFEPGQLVGNKGGGLGYGLPAALGAAIAEEQTDDPRSVIGYLGDGSYLYYPHTLYTAARHDIDVTVVVSNNRNYHILKENMVKILGGKKSDYEFVGMDFEPGVDIPANAESHGSTGRRIHTATELEEELENALDESGPTVLDVQVFD